MYSLLESMLLHKLDQPNAVGSASNILNGGSNVLKNLPTVYAGGSRG